MSGLYSIDDVVEYRLGDFINTELKEFSSLDNIRSIPSIIDGLKDSQRKALYGVLLHGASDIKIAQLAGATALDTKYGHGENSMAMTIIAMAQNFPGSNNINLFEPNGQFGSILSPEAASPRYIYTKQSKHLRKFFNKNDDAILTHRYDDDFKCEPLHYYPLMPMWIVNGALGIGTGHSVRILQRNPLSVKKVIASLIKGKELPKETLNDLLTPYFDGWMGVVNRLSDTSFRFDGVYEVVNSTTIRITVLPIGYTVHKFKDVLINLLDKGLIKDYHNNSTEDGFDFVIDVTRETTKKSNDEIMSMFKLSLTVTENITLWDTNNKITKYDDVYVALKEFYTFRIQKYVVRREHMLNEYSKSLHYLENMRSFIVHWNASNPHKLSDDELRDIFSDKIDMNLFDRFITIPIKNLTLSKVSELTKEIDKIKIDSEKLEKTSPLILYASDLV